MLDVHARPHFDFLSAEYAALFETSDATAFQNPIWLHHLYDVLAPAVGAEPLTVVVRRGDGRLAMVLPMLRKARGPLTLLEFADFGVSDYISPVCNKTTFTAIVDDELSRRRVVEALGRFDLMRIEKIRIDGLPLGELFRAVATEMDESAHALLLEGTYPEWRARFLDPTLVKEIRQKWRRLARLGAITFERVTDPASIEATLEAMRAFRAPRFCGRRGRDFLQDPAYFRFYRDVATSGAASGFARLSRLTLNGEIIAVDFGLTHRRAYLHLLRGYDLQKHKNRSLGMLAIDALLAEAVARGDSCFDLTIGDEAYKQLFGPKSTKLFAVTAQGTVFGKLAKSAAERLPRVHQTAKRLLGT